MCGIVGIAGPFGAEEGARLVTAMNRAILHRGPDDEGLWAGEGFAFAMRRLSIIDLPGGHQPMWTDDGLGIVFNGEIYNYRSLRDELEASGYRFETRSDTEVLLKLYHRDGPAALARLEGMFAAALYDRRSGKLHLVRDRFGVKPLYYGRLEGRLLFASEIKALLPALAKRPALDRAALQHYLTLRFVPAPDTVWQGIHKLPPGHWLEVDLAGGAQRLTRYWQLRFDAEPLDPERDYPKEFASLFLGAVERRLLAADVPVGVLLSGGLDSSAVSAAAVELGHRDFHTFSVAFDDPGAVDETPYARQVAAHVGSRHHEVRIDRGQFIDSLPELVRISDEPLADLATLPLLWVSRLAREHVKVVLSGEGSDELLAGYNMERITRTLQRLRRLDRVLPRALRRLAGALTPAGSDRLAYFRAWAQSDWRNALQQRPLHMTLHWDGAQKSRLWRQPDALPDSETLIRDWYREAGDVHPLDRLQQVYAGPWLTEDLLMKADKASMAASLELREPFLDRDLSEWAARLPLVWRVGDARVGWSSKRILRDFCRSRLPRDILERPKQGFPVPAYGWLKDRQGQGWANSLLLSADSRIHEHFHSGPVVAALAAAGRGETAAAHRVWLLLVLEHWLRVWQ